MHISPDVLVDALRSQGLRITVARRAVCAVVAERHGHHLTAASILEEARTEQGATVDQSTVYRTLDALQDAGLLAHSHLGHGPAVYHLVSEAAHQHVVCNECGATASIPAEDLADWVTTLQESTGFEIDPTHFAVTGLCAECAARR
ncbi:MAG: Fur family transcriptional regulator [Actinomycetota bacterium]|nr:Fur family transcriptional regulator [Actinomycetota bacterium]